MTSFVQRILILGGALLTCGSAVVGHTAEPTPPDGFRAIFNGRDLTGWHGLNPHSVAKLTGEKKEANLAQQRVDFPKNWTVENGELVNDGHGPYATTDEEFGDIELLLEYKTVPKADSGIYLRGTPQVQIWDWNQEFDPNRPHRKPSLGSGGLFNNTPDAAGRDPLVFADRPFGEWNQFRIRQIGDRTWVWLNGKQVVDNAVMENFWDRTQPLPAKGPIMLQTHGGEIRWRNIFVREIAAQEAGQLLSAAAAQTRTRSARGRDPIRLTHGPMLGKPTARSVAVWGRTSDQGEFTVHYGTAADRLDQVSRPAATSLDHDNTGVAQLTDLKSDTRYHYEIHVNGRPHGLPGSFRTLPSADDTRHAQHNPKGLFNFRFEIGSCANQNPLSGMGHRAPVYEHLNRQWADKVHFHIMNGDWLYEELRDYPAEAWRMTQGIEALPFAVQVMPSVVGVWENYKLYLSRGVELAKWHRHVPSYFTFDDHELLNDIYGSSEAGRRNRRTVFRDIGTYAWGDYLGWANPMVYDHPVHLGRARMQAGSDLLTDPHVDFTKLPLNEMLNLHVHWGTPEAGVTATQYDNDSGHKNSYVYDIAGVVDAHTLRLHMPAKVTDEVSYSIGRRSYGKFRVSNCEFYLLDTRGDRDMHDISQRDKPGTSMIGRHQREWLLKSMRESDADFFFVVSTVPFMIPHTGGGGGTDVIPENKEESWTGYFDERESLIAEWEKLGKKVFVMTGDLHNSFAIKVTDRVWEFCCGPHNSVNHVPVNDESGRPATGKWKFGPRECDIRWSSYILPDIPRLERLYPHFCIVQVNNVFNMPQKLGDKRWVAYPHPQVVFQYYDGRTGELDYAEAISVER